MTRNIRAIVLRVVLGLVAAGLFSQLPASSRAAVPDRPPNFVVLFADDLGYGDLGVYGHPSIRTRHLDRMAAEGMRFTDFYSAAPVCTPSRAALLTGRLPVRSGMYGDRRRVFYPDSPKGLPQAERTLPEELKKAGYATCIVGKWHLGAGPDHSPLRHGFDHFFGLPYSNDMDRTTNAPPGRLANEKPQMRYWNVPLLHNDQVVERPAQQASLTRRYTEEAIGFMRKHRAAPFFLYFAHTFPHVPLFASPEFRGKSPRGLYGDVVEELDWSVGQVLDSLRDLGLHTNTLVFFTSDNGPWLIQNQHGGSAGLLREGKGSTWEGGMREPAIAWWPGRVEAGTVTREMASTLDLFPTFLRLAGAPPVQNGPAVLDGVDITPVLVGNGPSPRNTMFFYRGSELWAVRQGPFKAHFVTRSGYGKDPRLEHSPPLLFHLAQDPGEIHNVANQHPEVIADIQREVERHRATNPVVPSLIDDPQ